jgi:S-disulfanyl-L-cysteine oxidoreductase SoxD
MSTRSHRVPAARAAIAAAILLTSVIGVATIVARQSVPSATSPAQTTVPSAPARQVVPKGPGLGVPATPAQLESADVSIGPDGSGLPPGSGTPSQGEEIFNTKCIACHGPRGSGTVNDQLVGGQGTLTTPTPIKTIGSYWPYATTVFDYVRRAMPYPTPHSLTDTEVYALTAYLLSLNGIVAKDAVMDAKTLPQVKMPNRGNFVLSYPDRKR